MFAMTKIYSLQFGVNMEEGTCVGCRTSFVEAERLPLDQPANDYHILDIPIKNDNSRWTLLKSIVSFLNSQGGTIYIGVQDRQGTVKGIFMDRKEKDNFKLQTKQLIEKIYPKVDLNNKQQVEIQYAPIFRGDNFEGKYLIKIIVQQGDPTHVYCLSEKIKMQEESKDGKPEQYQVFYAYERRQGGVMAQLKGESLASCLSAKATGGKAASIFHPQCNPPLPYISLQIRTLWFTNITQFTYDLLRRCYQVQFQKMDIDYTINYFKDSKRCEIYIEDEQDFQKVKEYITENVDYLNSIFKESTTVVQFQIKGEVQHYYLIENTGVRSKHPPGNEKKKKEEGKKDNQEDKKKKDSEEKIKKIPKREVSAKVENPKVEAKVEKAPGKNADNVIVFTHIAPPSISSLERYLRNSIYRAFEKKFVHYINSLQLHFQSHKEMQNYLSELLHKENQLAGYGFKQQIRYGFCTNKLKICNADWNKNKEMKLQLKEMMGENLVDIKNDKNSLVCEMKNRELTCEWLDLLLINRDFKKKFSIKGRPYDNTPKMKIYLEVDQTAKN